MRQVHFPRSGLVDDLVRNVDRKEAGVDFSPMVAHLRGMGMAEKIEIGRQQPLEMDSRGRVTIPANIREKHKIQPEEGKEIWVEVELKWAEIEDEDDGGDN